MKNRFLLIYTISILGTFLVTGCSSGPRYIPECRFPTTIYSEEDNQSQVIAIVPEGVRIHVISEGWGDWYKVQYNGTEGYVYAENCPLVDSNGETIWMRKAFLKGVGFIVGIIILIGLAIALISLVFAAITFLVGLLLRLAFWALGFGALGFILGYFFTADWDGTSKWIVAGAIIGAVIGIIRMIKDPIGESVQGIKTAKDSYNDYQQKEALREMEAAKRREEDYPLEMEDGTRAKRMFDGTLLDEKGREFVDNCDGTATQTN